MGAEIFKNQEEIAVKMKPEVKMKRDIKGVHILSSAHVVPNILKFP